MQARKAGQAYARRKNPLPKTLPGRGGDIMVVVVTGGFIVLDLITGTIKAFAEHNFASSVMREGLFHKVGSILCVALGMYADYAQQYIDLGVTIPVSGAICAYIALMEIGSIVENLAKINPEIVPEKIRKYFQGLEE